MQLSGHLTPLFFSIFGSRRLQGQRSSYSAAYYLLIYLLRSQ
jgi:hypothetical protein